jgi:glycosyltransferase involved in cell wall biosynthesis
LIKVSVVIPVYNDPSGLQDTLESLVAQNFPKDQYEIIVVDNGSTDKTLDVAKMHADKYPQLVKYVIEDNIQSSYAARNKGIIVAKGELISFIDADMTVREEWLIKIQSIFKDEDPDYLGCKVRVYAKNKSIASLYNVLHGFDVKSSMSNLHYAPTCCLTVKKKVFDKEGYFDSRLKSGGDTEYGERVWNTGSYKFYYAENIFMYHPSRDKLSKLVRKTIRIGRDGRGMVSCLYPERYSWINKLYLNYHRYLPENPLLIRKKYRCGYSFKVSTTIKLSILPMILHYISALAFLWAKLQYFMNRVH